MKGLTDKNLQVHFEKGSLQINYKEDIFMTGPVSEVERIDIPKPPYVFGKSEILE